MSSIRSYTKLFTFSRGLHVAPCQSCSGAAPPCKNISPPPQVVPLSEVRRFITQCMVTVGTPQGHAKDLASLLADADYRGHYSHGLSRLEMYVNDVKLKRIDSGVKPKIVKSTSITAWVDGHNGLGVVVGNFCMKLAVKMAKKSGIGWVVAKNSNHFGLASWYTLKALDHQLLGLSFTNTSSVMCSKCGRSTTLASNPMSIAAPGTQGDSFILNMATTAMSLKKPDVKNQKDLNIQKDIKNQKDVRNQKNVNNQEDVKNQKDLNIQKDIKNQKDVNNQEDAPKQPEEKRFAGLKEMGADVSYETACLLPAVAPEGPMGYTGYMGYGLGLVVETFCGILADAHHGLKEAPKGQEAANLGQCFVAVNPAHFAPGFEERLSNFLCSLRSQEQNEVENPVLVPGDPEKIHMRLVDRQGGVSYSDKQYKASALLAHKLGICHLKLK